MSELIFISMSTFSCISLVMNRDSGLLFKRFACSEFWEDNIFLLHWHQNWPCNCFGQWSMNRNMSLLSRNCESHILFNFCCDVRNVLHRDFSFYMGPSMKMMWTELKPTYWWTWIMKEDNSLFLSTIVIWRLLLHIT